LKGGDKKPFEQPTAKKAVFSHRKGLWVMSKTMSCSFLALSFVLFTVVASSAHLRTDRNWAAVQVPIGVDGIRDVQMDGDISEWDNVPSVFWVTHEDLIETVTGTQGDPDPSNLAERIIFGWSPVTNILYFMEERFDDFFYGTIENNFDRGFNL